MNLKLVFKMMKFNPERKNLFGMKIVVINREELLRIYIGFGTFTSIYMYIFT